MEINLNRNTFIVNEEEFPKYYHPQYTTLLLRPQLGIFEREISLIEYLSKSFDELNQCIFINYGLTHGGYVPIFLSGFGERYIVGGSSGHLDNFYENIKLFSKEEITVCDLLSDISLVSNKKQLQIIRLDSSNVPGTDMENILSHIKKNINTIILSYSGINLENYHSFKLTDSNLLLYIPGILIDEFRNKFRYYLVDNSVRYNNLINLCIMVKNAGEGFRDVLKQNLPYIDRWTVLDTGSTDNTVDIIKEVLKDKKGNLYQEPFINFRDSRNRCLDLAGKSCKFNIMLDDTYVLSGNVREFLSIIRSDEFADSYNVMIKSGDLIYGSNRITKSDRELRYVYKIHEIIQTENNVVVQIPSNQILINDIDNEYMQQRTNNRKQNDLILLFEEIEQNPNDPRNLYYIAQTYTCLKMWYKAFEYFQKRIEHPVEGYREEVTDAYFQCAYLSETQLNLEWDKCEEMYMKCYNHEPTRPDSLFCIGYHYYRENQNNKAFEYLKRGFKLGLPTTVTSNLRPYIYIKYIPQFLTGLCYQYKDHELGKEAAERYLYYNPPDNTIVSYLKIFELLALNQKQNQSIQINNRSKGTQGSNIFCFVADGGFKEWSGSSINKEGVGGSETYIIEMSRNIAKTTNFDVYVFCKTKRDEIFEGVKYRNINEYIWFLNQNKIHTCIISRFSEYIPVTIYNQVDNVFLVVHDLLPSGNVIPIDDKLKGIFCMTEWHKDYFLKVFPNMKNITHVFPNGINIDKYSDISENKTKYSFIYSSFPNRGLIHLLNMFPKIKKKLPNAHLNIFCDTRNSWVQSVAKDEMDQIERLLEEQKDCVTNHGWVSKDKLRKFWLKSEIWLYPCTFQETFCITALEAAASNTLAITTDLASLNETVGNRGVLVSGDPRSEEWQERAINKLIDILDNSNEKYKLLEKNRDWSSRLDWSILASRMVHEYISDVKYTPDTLKEQERLEYHGMLNWSSDIPKGSKIIFENILDRFIGKRCQILEIGTYTGTSVINILKYLPDSQAMTIDMWEDYEESNLSRSMVKNTIEDIFYNNIKIANIITRIIPIKGDSKDILPQLVRNNSRFDFIYVDGSHKCLDCYSDMIISWELLSDGGIIGIDDYLWNNERNEVLDIPYHAVEHFMDRYKGKFKLLYKGYRVFLQKI